MRKLRSTFKRSRTPTGAEMKSQSSLEVPKQVRSASFDEIQLEVQRLDQNSEMRQTRGPGPGPGSGSPIRTSLKVPVATSQRSRSFDMYEKSSLLGTTSRSVRKELLVQVACYHCVCVEEFKKLSQARSESDKDSDDDSTGSTHLRVCNDDYDADDDLPRSDASDRSESALEDENEGPRDGSPEIRVTLLNFDEYDVDGSSDEGIRVEFVPERTRRLSRQEALIELPAILGPEEDDDDEEEDDEVEKAKLVVRDIFLTVPELKRDRAASVDSCFNSAKSCQSDDSGCLTVPQQGARSKSVDIVLPTDQQTRYTALLPNKDDRRGGKSDSGASSSRELRSTPDWSSEAINGEHLWVPTAASGEFCYANDCSKHGPRVKCAACRVVAHTLCAAGLNFSCKSSFRDVDVRQYREQTSTQHHWVHRRSQKGKCANCSKAFQSKLSFSSKEIVAVSCSWCKSAYHNKEACFNVEKIGENCELGVHNRIIVPPSWIVKLPRKGLFKSSLRKSPRKRKSGKGDSTRRKSVAPGDPKDQGKIWVVKPIPTPTVKPVIVFINPKSGGNQGAKLLQKFQWLLNPRQVFDLTQGGPRMGLELFQKVPNLRVLACGGDGTVGWVLSILDQIGVSPPPAVGVLPLGTGNDLARALGWGGGYTDEPIGKILSNIGDSDTTLLDRWEVAVEKNPDAAEEDDGKGKDNLPLNVVNNYFSLGVDAHIALEFHEAREAHPEKFNSRLRNKMFYGQMGGKDLVRRKWKDLSEFVTLECDGQDMTPKLKEHRVHAIVFLNIPSYGGGTHPWGGGSGTKEPSTEDGLLEVVGLTTYQLPLLQAGGHGTCITQCSRARLVTTRTIPMQVDGEACRVLPSIMEIKLLNRATMLAKRRSSGKGRTRSQGDKLESLKLQIMRIKMKDYETYHSDKERLIGAAVPLTPEPLDLEATMDLESLRKLLARDFNMDNCCFLDCEIDRAQEQLHYVTDVASEAVFVLEEDAAVTNIEEAGKADASPSEERPSTRSKPKAPERPAESIPDESINVEGKSINLEQSNVDKGQKSKDSVEKDVPVEGSTETQRHSPDNDNDKVNEESVPKKEPEPRQSSSKSVAPERFDRAPSSAFISARERLFSLAPEVQLGMNPLLEKPSDGIIRAAKTGDLKSLRELHSRGYSLLSIDANGQTALHLAARHGYKDIVRYLIACAPPSILNMADNDKGQTALHKAAQQKRRSICCMLVAGGATLTAKDRHGNTPRELALMSEDRDLAAYLYSQEQFHLDTEDMLLNLP
ncbi:Similar to rdgA: Eye-specific diacylglycerol kinase (Drosophila melanogaster) [Cotesia congregata]|uniref:Diacylglycerol kinase n=1 Tax=Cotesia congregata TaxID=51543 RepID=A0A8J2ECT7_COTCN|nr:Similar to rdgA: Eye-specific diacylglycerol kinase (Drosophila melanogaster) [Cotesia congregata]